VKIADGESVHMGVWMCVRIVFALFYSIEFIWKLFFLFSSVVGEHPSPFSAYPSLPSLPHSHPQDASRTTSTDQMWIRRISGCCAMKMEEKSQMWGSIWGLCSVSLWCKKAIMVGFLSKRGEGGGRRKGECV
jgi:hypothetical protein